MEYMVMLSMIISMFTLYVGEIPVIASLGAVIALLCLIVVGTFSALLIITHKYYKKGIAIIVLII
jgi:hypothetical protein